MKTRLYLMHIQKIHHTNSIHSFISQIESVFQWLIKYNRVFLKVDQSGSSARIVLEQNKFSQKVTTNWD